LAGVGHNKITIAGKEFLLTGTNNTTTNTLEGIISSSIESALISPMVILLLLVVLLTRQALVIGFGACTSIVYLLRLLKPLTSLTPVSLAPLLLIEVSMCSAEVAETPVCVASMRIVLPLPSIW
jgi:hypothetical protein